MNSEEKFKKDLNDLLSSKEFAFDALEWEKTSAMLDAKKRKKRLAFILFSGLLFILGGTILVFLPATDKSDAIAETSNPTDTEFKISVKIAAKNVDTMTNNAPTPSTINSLKNNSKRNSLIADPSKDINALAKDIDTKASVPKTAPASITTTVEQENLISVIGTPPSDNSPEGEKTDLTNSPSVNPFADKDDSEIALVPSPVIADSEKTIDEAKVVTATPTKTSAEKTQEQKSESQVTAADTSTTLQIETDIVKSDSTATVDSTIAGLAVAKPDTDYVKRKRPEITLEGGASYLFGWKTSLGRDARGFNAVIGINYMHKLATDLKVGIGLQYSAVGHLKYSNYTSKITRLDLGEISEVTHFTPQKIHYVWMPIKIHYAVNEKSAIGGGITVGYLLTIDSKVERFGQSIQGQSNYQVSKEKGYTQGFNEMDAQISMFYQHKIFGRFYGNGEFVYGIRDIKNGEILSSEGFERNLGFKLTLLYRLFDN